MKKNEFFNSHKAKEILMQQQTSIKKKKRHIQKCFIRKAALLEVEGILLQGRECLEFWFICVRKIVSFLFLKLIRTKTDCKAEK